MSRKQGDTPTRFAGQPGHPTALLFGDLTPQIDVRIFSNTSVTGKFRTSESIAIQFQIDIYFMR